MMTSESNNLSIEIEEDVEYQRQLAVFVKCSTEKGIEWVKIGEVIAGLPRRMNFLDIGAGGGDLTIPVSHSFDATMVVEPNKKQAKLLKRRCPNFKIINDVWEHADLGQERHDFILCSHVLYYIEESNWLATVEKMFDHLSEGGCIVIVLQSPIGEVAAFFKQFTSYDVNILELWRDLIRRYGDDAIEVRYFQNEIWTEDLKEMVTIGLFLLINPRFKMYEDDIRKYFEMHHKTDSGYRIRQDEILLIIRKKTT